MTLAEDITREESIKQVRDVGACCMRYKELAHFLCKFYVKEMGFKVFL